MLTGIEGRTVWEEVLMEWTSYFARDERGRSGSICVRFERDVDEQGLQRPWDIGILGRLFSEKCTMRFVLRNASMRKSVG